MEAWHKRTPFLQNISQCLLLDIASIFFRIEEGRRAFEEEKNEFLQKSIKENSNNLVQNQEQVTPSSTVSVMKTSTSSCCSGKSQISSKSSSSGSRE